jgi:hypothetical protein
MKWGLANGLRIRVMDEPIEFLDRMTQRLGPERVSGMAGDDLSGAETPIEAAEMALENFLGSLENLTGIPAR